MRTLQDILDDFPFADLPPAWQDHDLMRFSAAKRLWDYQQEEDPTRPGKVEFEDGTAVDLQNPPWELVKPLIWW